MLSKFEKQGFECEKKLKEVIKSVVGEIEETDRYDSFDFKGDGFVVELKSRNYRSSAFSEWMLSKDKYNAMCRYIGEGGRAFLFYYFVKDDTLCWYEIKGDEEKDLVCSKNGSVKTQRYFHRYNKNWITNVFIHSFKFFSV